MDGKRQWRLNARSVGTSITPMVRLKLSGMTGVLTLLVPILSLLMILVSVTFVLFLSAIGVGYLLILYRWLAG